MQDAHLVPAEGLDDGLQLAYAHEVAPRVHQQPAVRPPRRILDMDRNRGDAVGALLAAQDAQLVE